MVNSAEDVVVNPAGFVIAQMVVVSVKSFSFNSRLDGWSSPWAHQMPVARCASEGGQGAGSLRADRRKA